MVYEPTIWKDRAIEKPRTFTLQNNPDGTVTLVPVPGVVVEAGTPVNAANLNKIEQGLKTHQVSNATKTELGHIKIGTGLSIDGNGTVSSEKVPTGTIIWYAKNIPPDGYLKANGALISRGIYADLFAIIGATFGVGDGSTTFKLPELRGEFIRAWDDGRSVDTNRTFGSFQNYQTGTSEAALGGGSSGSYPHHATMSGVESRPRNVAMLACIKY